MCWKAGCLFHTDQFLGCPISYISDVNTQAHCSQQNKFPLTLKCCLMTKPCCQVSQSFGWFERKYQKACPFIQYPQFTEFNHFSFEIGHNSHFNMDFMSLDTEMNRKITLTMANKMNFHIQKKRRSEGSICHPRSPLQKNDKIPNSLTPPFEPK